MEKWSEARGDEWILMVWNGTGAGGDMEMEMNEAQREEHDRFHSWTALNGSPVVNRKQTSAAVADIFFKLR